MSTGTREENIDANIDFLFRALSKKDAEITALRNRLEELEKITKHLRPN